MQRSDELAPQFFETEAREHFRAEEELLLPAFARHCATDDPDLVRVLVEHVEIRRRAQDLEIGPGDVDEMHVLGELLNAHVRYEERKLLPRVEEALGPDELTALGAALARLDRAAG